MKIEDDSKENKSKENNSSLDLISSLLLYQTPWDVVSQAINLLKDKNLIDFKNNSDDKIKLLLLLSSPYLIYFDKKFDVDHISLHLIGKNSINNLNNEKFIKDLISWFGVEELSKPLKQLDNMSFFEISLHFLHINSQIENTWSTAYKFLREVPKDILNNWKSNVSLYKSNLQPKFKNQPQNIVESVCIASYNNHLSKSNSHDNTIKVLIDKDLSFDFNVQVKNSEYMPIACFFTIKEQWHHYLKQGANPDINVQKYDVYDNSLSLVPLWQYLIENSNKELSLEIKKWANDNKMQESSKFSTENYFKKLEARTRYGVHSLSSLKEILRSHPKWYELKDDEGRTSAMYIIGKHHLAHKELLLKKFIPMIEDRDNKGRSLAFYALKDFLKTGEDKLKFILSNDKILEPDKNGNGLIYQLLEDNNKFVLPISSLNEHKNIYSKIRKTKFNSWFGIEKGNEDKFVDYLIENFKPFENRSSSPIYNLVDIFIDDVVSLDNKVKGMLVLYVAYKLSEENQSTKYILRDNVDEGSIKNIVDRLIDSGAYLPNMTNDKLDYWLSDRYGNKSEDFLPYFQEIKARMEKNNIEQSINQVITKKDSRKKNRKI